MRRNVCVCIPAMTLAHGVSGADGKVAQRGTISLSESLEASRSRTAAPELGNSEHQAYKLPLFRKRQARARLLKLDRPERRTLLRSGSSRSIVVLSNLELNQIDRKLRFGHGRKLLLTVNKANSELGLGGELGGGFRFLPNRPSRLHQTVWPCLSSLNCLGEFFCSF